MKYTQHSANKNVNQYMKAETFRADTYVKRFQVAYFIRFLR